MNGKQLRTRVMLSRSDRRGRAAVFAILFLGAASAWAAPAKGGGIDVSGVVDALAAGTALTDYGTGASWSYGFEQYANLRMKTRIGGHGTLYAAANLIAAAGDAASPASPFVAGARYAAAFEPERLYFRVEGETADVEIGLMRLAFGYGTAWKPSDFLSPPNPLLPAARTRGVLAAAASAYPADEWKLKAFAAGPEDPLDSDGSGLILGGSADLHLSRASFQALYAWQAAAAAKSVHRIGFSAKVEAEVGITVDALYTLDAAVLSSGNYYDEKWNGSQGLKASAGIDYSLLGGKLYVLAQYLFNGGGALDPGETVGNLYTSGSAWYQSAPASRSIRSDIPIGSLNRKNYAYTTVTYKLDDYTSATADCVVAIDDLSFSPSVSISHEPFQGLTLGLSCRVPLDARVFSSGGEYGELGPTNTGTRALVTARAKIKF